ncbi:hypothetical protein [Krasilnikovia sp. M28-CT-15]|uniref:LppU/SCO3897 family protein n=1 Tax=Krasilnikovia sp. M28-CT-15 TaxID=3373540 RepID=UPI0038762462
MSNPVEPTPAPEGGKSPASDPSAAASAPGAQVPTPGAPASAPGAPASAPGAPASAPGAPASAPGAPVSAPGAPVSDPSATTSAPSALVSAPIAPGAAAAAPKKKSKVGRIILALVAVLFLGVVGLVLRVVLAPDPTKDAKAGDCLASEAAKNVKVGQQTAAEMKMVDCSASDAAFVVLGRVDGVTDIKNPACEKYVKEGEQYLAYASQSGDGYLLCLKPKS